MVPASMLMRSPDMTSAWFASRAKLGYKHASVDSSMRDCRLDPAEYDRHARRRTRQRSFRMVNALLDFGNEDGAQRVHRRRRRHCERQAQCRDR